MQRARALAEKALYPARVASLGRNAYLYRDDITVDMQSYISVGIMLIVTARISVSWVDKISVQELAKRLGAECVPSWVMWLKKF